MKQKAIITAAIIAAFAACVAQRSQVEEVPVESEQTAVVAIHTACAPTETPLAVSHKAVELTKQPKSITRYAPQKTPQPMPEPTELPAPAETPASTPTPPPTPTAPAHSGYGGYAPGFGWIESQGAGQCIYDTQIYENGNKVGIMN